MWDRLKREMQFILTGGGRRVRHFAIAALIGLASFAQAQVSLSVLAKAVAETGSGVSSRGAVDESDSGSGVPAGPTSIGGGTLSGPGAGSLTQGGSKTGGLAQQLQHAQGPTAFSGDQKLPHSGSTDQSPDSGGQVSLAQSISSGSSGSMGMSPGDAETLSERRQLAIGVAGAGGLFIFGVFLATHITRNRRMAMRYHE